MSQLSAEQELDLLKATFKDNEALLKLLRALWFGFELTDEEKEHIRGTFQNENLRTAVRKKVYTILGDNAPIGSLPDFWLNVTEQQLVGVGREAIYQLVASKAELLKKFEQGIALLADPSGERVNLDFELKSLELDPWAIRLMARNLYMKAMETGLHLINLAVNAKVETPVETKKKQAQNSSK